MNMNELYVYSDNAYNAVRKKMCYEDIVRKGE